MQTTLQSLQDVYVSLGGDLTDTYDSIANGIAVRDYVTIPDALQAIAQISGSTLELPAVSATDDGDVLTVVDGKWAKADIPAQLPAVTAADEGSALIVNSSGEWGKGAIPNELPAVTASDNGKVLGVENGAWGSVKYGKVVEYTLTNVGNTPFPSAGREVGIPSGFANFNAFKTQVRADLDAGNMVILKTGNVYSDTYGRAHYVNSGTGTMTFTDVIGYSSLTSSCNLLIFEIDEINQKIKGFYRAIATT